MNDHTPVVIADLLKVYDLMVPDERRVGKDIDMLTCPLESECGKTMRKAIELGEDCLGFERFVVRVGGDESEGVKHIMSLKNRLWDVLEMLYYG